MVTPNAPWLVCVELRAERTMLGSPTYSPQAPEVIPNIRSLIAHARLNEWNVVHVQRRAPRVRSGPISGLEPLIDEPVYYLDSPSAFAGEILRERALDERDSTFYFVGFAARDTILPSITGGRDLGLRVAVVEDAIACSYSEGWRADEVVGLLQMQLTPTITRMTSDLIAGRRASVVNLRDFAVGAGRR